MSIVVRERIPLAPYTTLGLGGPARYFCECAMEADVLEALALARSRGL
ncbi:MAG: UDP-N-acetylenolpyruvoylglucosamine reductase, partial [Gemmatimonadetes bacterium]